MDTALTVMLVLLVLFVIGREVVCWYFKLSKITTLLTEIRDGLKK